MKMLTLTIDLPPTAYTITDKPCPTQQLADALMTLFSSIILILAAIGWGMIYAVNKAGNGLKSLIEIVNQLALIIDGWMIALIIFLITIIVNRSVYYTA